jgi:hypothetical protein
MTVNIFANWRSMDVGIYLPAGVGDLATGLADYEEESGQRVNPSEISK